MPNGKPYSNDYLDDRIKLALKELRKRGFRIRTVRIEMNKEHVEAVRRFAERVEDVYRRSRESHNPTKYAICLP